MTMSTPSTKSARVFTREFKLDVCRQVQSGQKRPAQACREHQLTEGLLLRWRREYEQRGEAAFSPRENNEASPAASLEQKVAELERFCGQLSLENALLKKLVSTLRSPKGTP
jgi:transposase